jgi:urea carboxylase
VFDCVLVANRGTIARRILRTLRRMGIRSVAVYSDADADSLHVSEADVSVRIGAGPARESYLDVEAILAAARATGAQAIHPGYGFLSENADFAVRCEEAGLAFIGPTPDTMRRFGLKHTAREIAAAANVPVLSGSSLLPSAAAAVDAAARIGYPVMLKATAGGGGIGMRACADAAAVTAAFDAVARLGGNNFGDTGVFLERLVRRARHVEVQVFGDGRGRVIALGERDCSLQRRNQKVIEETPAPGILPATRAALLGSAVRLAGAVNYRSAGTVEYLYDDERGEFYFLEVNTRLQVEHGITEQVTGVDLVEWMVRVAAGETDCLDRWPGTTSGASIEARLYAEDPHLDYRPSAGLLTRVEFPADARVETWVATGSVVSAFYDPMVAKLIVTAPDRPAAVAALQQALDETHIDGLETNVDWLRTVARNPDFVAGKVSTGLLATIPFAPATIQVLSGGLATSVQEYPGRRGYWSIGVPPSGPFDPLGFRLGNRLLGNPDDAAGLEITASGPTLRFNLACRICLTGAPAEAALDDVPVAQYQVIAVGAGQTLRVGRVTGPGLRAYLLLAGGIAVPTYLGSRATFTLGGFGGHAGRNLATGDVLRLVAARDATAHAAGAATLPAAAKPTLGSPWEIRVLYGPHGAPDFFTGEDIATIQDAAWRVHYNSNRTGVRLIGPKPRWARRDGGEAGLHPSNIHDNAYAIGAVDFTGDMPIILGPDGPSLGGFVCPFVVIEADLWKVGQLVPGDTVRFVAVDAAAAAAARRAEDTRLATLAAPPTPAPAPAAPADPADPADPVIPATPAVAARPPSDPILATVPAAGARPQAVYRAQGDRHLLLEYGPLVLDLELRIRVHALMQGLAEVSLPGIIDVTPGIRSLQIHYEPRQLAVGPLLDALLAADERLGALDGFEVLSRVVHLPLAWRDPAVQQTIDKYMTSVRDDAPWCPDNIEFIRRINGLPSVDEVERIVFGARYLVLGLGDVYLGAPVATPLDPRHRLVTTKYNPARTWTPPNVVGIGGAYLCIYGMEGPGGYQLFGRTVQVWNTHRQTQDFTDGKPWLLRFFDQIRFFPVTAAELEDWRRDFPLGKRRLRIETERFRLADYRRFLAAEEASIRAFETRRQQAFAAERADWERRGEFSRAEAAAAGTADVPAALVEAPAGCILVEAPLGGSVVRIAVQVGDVVARDATLVVIEAMKAECAVNSSARAVVRALYVTERQAVTPGLALAALEILP